MSRLNDLDFGRTDAESDESLPEYFLNTGTVDRIARGAKLVVGRKGSGKTALFKYLPSALPGTTVELDLRSYIWEFHRDLREQGLPSDQAYTTSWKLLILLAAYAAVRESLPDAERASADEAVEKLGMRDQALLSRIAGWFKRVRRVDLPSIPILVDGGGLEVNPAEKPLLSPAFSDALEGLESALREAYEDVPFTVLLDRLDDAWDGSEESLDLIAGAIRATRDIGIAIRTRNAPSPVVTFLREDLWDRVSFNDRNKMSQDTIFLEWTPESLGDVIALRIRHSLGIDPEAAWAEAFTTEEMRQRARAKTYITKRTLGRPRDIVAFAIFCREAAVAAGHDRIEAVDIYAAERQYSRHLLDELKDEMEAHTPDYTAVVRALKQLGTRNFALGDWIAASKKAGMTVKVARESLDALVDASVVGVHATGGAQGGSATIFRYEDRHLQVPDGGRLQVHLGLVKELGLRDA